MVRRCIKTFVCTDACLRQELFVQLGNKFVLQLILIFFIKYGCQDRIILNLHNLKCGCLLCCLTSLSHMKEALVTKL